MSESKSWRLGGAVPLAVLGALLAVVACTEKRTDLGGDPELPPAFVDPDASVAADAGDLRRYCPSDRCPPGNTTCPSSQFLCDVDLLTDINNCGECGNACPKGGVAETYVCTEGRCVMMCDVSGALDCDGIPDNGCESSPWSNDSCGACNVKCSPDTPCIARGTPDLGCGCRPGEINCGAMLFPCVDPKYDDKNCGACNKACPPEGDGSEERKPNTYFGCGDSKCGALKCAPGFGDCDAVRENGCEVPLLSDDHCGACGNKCQNGMFCGLHPWTGPQCMCPEGLTFCGSCDGGVCVGECIDLATNKNHCGACGSSCGGSGSITTRDQCIYGKCERTCAAGWADCNGNRDDGCETNVRADPKNCGACGTVCNAIAGQACADGLCMVEPCVVLEDAGGQAR